MHNFKLKYQRFIHKYQDEQVVKGYLYFNLILPFVLVLLTETLAAHSLIGGFRFIIYHPYAYLVNVMLVMTSLSISMLLSRRICSLLLIAFFWLVLGIINGVVLIFRVTPFAGSDLLLLKDGKDIISKYIGPLQIIGILIIAVLVLVVVLYFVIITPKEEHYPPFIKRSLPSIILFVGATWGLIVMGQHFGLLETEFRELSASYRKNGFYYCFTASIVNTGIQKPSDYSQEVIEEITVLDELPEEDNSTHSRKPNVVIVQLETFFNVNRLKNVRFSENPLPNLTSIMDVYPSGLLGVPVVGAGTVNSEFEVLTGMNIDDFGIGEYPFKTIVKQQPCESIAYLLKENGYNTFAIHNNTGDFYERNQVYRNLGFDVFTSVEYMWPTDYTPMDWCKDMTLVGQIQTALDSTPSQDLVYTVSVQGHGSYPESSDIDYEKHIEIVESDITDEAYLNQLTYYVNQLYEMDQFIGKLIEMLLSHKEPTILVMYGDHLPSLDLTDDDLKWGNTYQTEYFIWNNANLSFYGYDREAFTLSSEVLNTLGITTGAINSYHQNSKFKLRRGTLPLDEYLAGLKGLEYDILYGDNIYYEGKNPFETTDMRMGFYPIAIEGAEVTKDKVLILTGTNFTRYSSIKINDSDITTLYINPTMLVASDITLNSGDTIVVSQNGLSESEPFIYP